MIEDWLMIAIIIVAFCMYYYYVSTNGRNKK